MSQLTLLNPSTSNLPSHIISELTGGLSDNTSRAYLSDIRSFYGVESLDNLTVDMITSITVGQANAYLSELHDSGMANATINRKMQALSKFYKILCRRDVKLMDYNPFSRDEGAVRLKQKSYSSTRSLEDDEVKKFMDVLGTLKGLSGLRDRIIVIIMITIGLRRAEIASLQIGQIKRTQGKFIIEFSAKGRKDRIVVISDQLKNLIDNYLMARGVSYADKDLPLFVGHAYNSDPTKSMTPQTIYDSVKKIAKKAGIHEESVSPHCFRHTFATKTLDMGYAIEKVQDLLGHSDISTTRRYDHTRNTLNNSPVDKIEQVYNLFDTNPDFLQTQ